MLVSVVVPCFNEQATLRQSVAAVLEAFNEAPQLDLELLIVDDCSRDASAEIATEISRDHDAVHLLRHEQNRGKGAALRTGVTSADGDVITIHDADLEYDPRDLVRLIEPIERGVADVVYGSRFLNGGVCRVLYFWHSTGNRFLTLLSNMMTDLNLTDMETCYKVFRREVLDAITIEEDRFGFEPEITAKVAAQRVRVYEMAISYYGRTYEEGKKIGARDGLRALYCIVRYSANRAPWFLQAMVYAPIGATSALLNAGAFAAINTAGVPTTASAAIAFGLAAATNYWLCIRLLFRRNAKWSTPVELAVYSAVVLTVGAIDLAITSALAERAGLTPILAKAISAAACFVLGFIGRRRLVFPEPRLGPWRSTAVEAGEDLQALDDAKPR